MLKNTNRRNGKVVHTNMLWPSDEGMIALGFAVEERFVDVLNMWLRVKGEELTPPVELNRDLLLWRQLRVRHNKLDYRHTEDEYKATKRVADWTMKIKCELTNQPYTPVAWGD